MLKKILLSLLVAMMIVPAFGFRQRTISKQVTINNIRQIPIHSIRVTPQSIPSYFISPSIIDIPITPITPIRCRQIVIYPRPHVYAQRIVYKPFTPPHFCVGHYRWHLIPRPILAHRQLAYTQIGLNMVPYVVTEINM